MHVEISTDNTISGSAELNAALTDTVRHGLAHFEAHVTRVEVHLKDRNAEKIGTGGYRMHPRGAAQGTAARGHKTRPPTPSRRRRKGLPAR